jgi:hypothetical protein
MKRDQEEWTMKKHEVEFLVSGEITWVNRSGTKEVRQCVRAGDRMTLAVVHRGEDCELFDGSYSILIPADRIRINA